jgi:hypothetical protein
MRKSIGFTILIYHIDQLGRKSYMITYIIQTKLVKLVSIHDKKSLQLKMGHFLNLRDVTYKKSTAVRHQWLMLVILATQEAEIRRITV